MKSLFKHTAGILLLCTLLLAVLVVQLQSAAPAKPDPNFIISPSDLKTHGALPIYQPTLTHTVINDIYPAWSPKMAYNHDSDITFFKGRYYCAWNANPTGEPEGQPGQFNYLSTSEDFIRWSTPIRPFSSEAGSKPPVNCDGQWQPCFINYRNETLFCNWCTTGAGKDPFPAWEKGTILSSSSDGASWKNQLLPSYPDAFVGEAFGTAGFKPFAFPGSHGLLTSRGVMLFPNGFAGTAKKLGLDARALHAALRSEDGGKTWDWGRPSPPLEAKSMVPDPANYAGDKHAKVWEPVYFEHPDGRIGALLRHVSDLLVDQPQPENRMLYAESRDEGLTWPVPRPVEVDTVSSRFAAFSGCTTPDSLFVVANDWLANHPRAAKDRQYLALFVAPVCDPDLLLPGPVIQQPGAPGHYPNGEFHDGKLTVSYSYGWHPRALYGVQIANLPDFYEPFLLPRGSRPPVRFDNGEIFFSETTSSLGLVLTKALTEQDTLHLAFAAKVVHTPFSKSTPAISPWKPTPADEGVTLITLGGKTRGGTALRVVGQGDLQVRTPAEWVTLGKVRLGQWIDYEITLGKKSLTVTASGLKPRTFDLALLRKISFGGLYLEPVAYPTEGSFRLDRTRLRVW